VVGRKLSVIVFGVGNLLKKGLRLSTSGYIHGRLGVSLFMVIRRRFVMTKQHEAILKLLAGFQRTFGKNYCRPTHKTILKRLKEFYGIVMSERTLCRRLKELREWGYLWKIVRHIRGKGIKMVCRATAYYLMEKTKQYFFRMRRGAERLVVCFRAAKFGSRLGLKQEHDLKAVHPDVEILWKVGLKGGASHI